MNNEFLNLPKESQAALIKSAENSLGLVDMVIEKDIWVCKLLEIIFSMPYNFVFRGGTSLSKAYGLIQRFSEDVDITIDYRHFIEPVDLESVSRSGLKKISSDLKTALSDFIHTHVIHHLDEQIKKSLPNLDIKIVAETAGEQVRVYYPSALNLGPGYLRDHVLLEFGTRNEIDPQEKHIIKPYLAQAITQEIILPMPTIDTLSPLRTFWEKSTLIHVECNRDKLQHSPDRLSRHWYDIFILNHSWVGPMAMTNQDILKKVINHKKAFFNASYANYDDCLAGKFRIIPDMGSLQGLEKDYNLMRESGMFLNEAPAFIDMINSLREYENQLNNLLNAPQS